MYARMYFLALFSIIAIANASAQSWKALNGPTGAVTVASIITYEKGEIYTLIRSGKMFRSLDKAKTWENISLGLEQIANRSNSLEEKYLCPQVAYCISSSRHQNRGS